MGLGIIKGVGCSMDVFGVEETDSLAHETTDDRMDLGCGEPDDMDLEGRNVWNGGEGWTCGTWRTDQDPRNPARVLIAGIFAPILSSIITLLPNNE
jgi:hypothetical protein